MFSALKGVLKEPQCKKETLCSYILFKKFKKKFLINSLKEKKNSSLLYKNLCSKGGLFEKVMKQGSFKFEYMKQI